MPFVLKVVVESVELEIFCQRHAVADGFYDVVVVVDVVVKNGTDNDILTGLDIEELGVVARKHMLYGQCQVSAASSQIDPIGGRHGHS